MHSAQLRKILFFEKRKNKKHSFLVSLIWRIFWWSLFPPHKISLYFCWVADSLDNFFVETNGNSVVIWSTLLVFQPKRMLSIFMLFSMTFGYLCEHNHSRNFQSAFWHSFLNILDIWLPCISFFLFLKMWNEEIKKEHSSKKAIDKIWTCNHWIHRPILYH